MQLAPNPVCYGHGLLSRGALVTPMPPVARLLAAALLCLIATVGAVATATQAPWLGLGLRVEGERIVVTRAQGPAEAVPVGAVVESVGGVALRPDDLIEEPDTIERYAELAVFFERQALLTARLHAGVVQVEASGRDGTHRYLLDPRPSRPPASLPAPFWFQLIVGGAGFFIGCWVLALRPHENAARLFALSGAMLLLSADAAAVYSARELALPEALFHALSALNHVGSLGFGGALASLFLCYPRVLCRPRWLVVPPVLSAAWVALDVLQAWPSPAVGMYLPVLLLTTLILALIVVQWRRSQGDPLARVALRWLGSLAAASCLLFSAAFAAPLVLGDDPLVPQSYAFGFFLVFYAGFALGLRRTRLLDLQEWAPRLLLWTGGAMLLLVLDAALLWLLHLNHRVSLGLALVACGFVWLPLRNRAWSWLVSRPRLDERDSFAAVLDVAFTVTDAERATGWSELLRRVFDPLVLEPAPAHRDDRVRLEEEGASLVLPAVASSDPLRLSLPWRGRGLFGQRDLRHAEALASLMRHADAGRRSYDRGVAEERKRITRDLHDDLGARLLSSLHEDDLDSTRTSIRHAMDDLRSLVKSIGGRSVSISDALADLRHEAAERLTAARITLDWPIDEVAGSRAAPDGDVRLDHLAYHHLASMIREGISNVIRHAGASRVEVRCALRDGLLTVLLSDDGRGFDPHLAGARRGSGLDNLHARALEVGGSVTLRRESNRTQVELRVPLAGATTRTRPDAA